MTQILPVTGQIKALLTRALTLGKFAQCLADWTYRALQDIDAACRLVESLGRGDFHSYAHRAAREG